MLFDLTDLVRKYQMQITGILHVGAHLGEEAAKYHENNVQRVWWIEGNPALMPPLRTNVAPYGHEVICALVTDKDGEVTNFNITNNGQSSSVLEFGTHAIVSPDVHFIGRQALPSITIDTLVQQHNITNCNFINMDLQGAELLALRGATEFLKGVNYIYSEVNANYLYQGCALVHEIDAFLSDFVRTDTHMTPHEWGDALYVRRGHVPQV